MSSDGKCASGKASRPTAHFFKVKRTLNKENHFVSIFLSTLATVIPSHPLFSHISSFLLPSSFPSNLFPLCLSLSLRLLFTFPSPLLSSLPSLPPSSPPYLYLPLPFPLPSSPPCLSLFLPSPLTFPSPFLASLPSFPLPFPLPSSPLPP